jgi:hypothetical protein
MRTRKHAGLYSLLHGVVVAVTIAAQMLLQPLPQWSQSLRINTVHHYHVTDQVGLPAPAEKRAHSLCCGWA